MTPPKSAFWRWMFRQYITADNRWTLSGTAVRDNARASSPEGAAWVTNMDNRKAYRKARRHQRRMTVGGAVVGGLVAGPVGAVGLGVAENALNRTTKPTFVTADEEGTD